jgi:hypothetical protein
MPNLSTQGNRRLSFFAAALVVALAGKIMYGFILANQPFYFYGSLPEQVLEYTAAKNFARSGFLKTYFLADYSSSPSAVDHPYIYTHMPSGPAVFLGFLFKLGARLLTARLVFAAISLLGCILFYLLVLEVTGAASTAALAIVLYSFNFSGFIEWSDHFTHSFYGPDFFGPLLFYFRFLRRQSKAELIGFVSFLALGLVTNYIAALPTVVSVVALHCFFNRESRYSQKLLALTFATIASVGAFHFLQNCLALGFKVAIRDVLYTLGNRIAGIPSKSSLTGLYIKNKIVLWGSDTIQGAALLEWLSSAFLTPLKQPAALVSFFLIGCGFFFGFIRFNPSDRFRPIRLLGVIFLAPYSWYLLFVSHGSIYSLPFIHRFFAIGLFLSASYLIYLGAEDLLGGRRHRSSMPAAATSFDRLGPIWLASVTIAFVTTVASNIRQTCDVKLLYRYAKNWEAQSSPDFQTYKKISSLLPRDAVVTTNLDGAIADFFAPNVLVFGGCQSSALLSLKTNLCPSTFLDEETRRSAKPGYLWVSYHYLPGYSDCHDDACLNALVGRLKKSYDVLGSVKNMWVLFDLSEKKMSQQHRDSRACA